MDNEGSVNDQMTDVVTQMNTLLLGNSGPQAMGLVDVAGAETLSMSMYNAVSSQQNSQVAASAAATATCAKMLQAQAQLPTPKSSDKVETQPDLPPPFMPLEPDKSGTASELIAQASVLADSAARILKKNKQEGSANSEELQKLIATLQSYVKSDNSSPEAAPSDNTSVKKSGGSDTEKKG